MSTEAVAKAQETPYQKKMRLRKEFAKKNQKSVSVKVQEMEYADWNPTARMTLLVIALGQRINEDAYVPEECPLQMPDDILGWCDLAEWRIALRVGKCDARYRRSSPSLKRTASLRSSAGKTTTIRTTTCTVSLSLSWMNYSVRNRRNAERPPRYKTSTQGNEGTPG
jgi:hypothetical protein